MFFDAQRLTCDEAAYHVRPEWSYSQWKQIDQPEYFHGLYLAEPRVYTFNVTADMVFGSNVHGDFLEAKKCCAVPAVYLTSNGQRRGKMYEDYQDQHPSWECLSPGELEAVEGLRRSITEQPKIANLLWGEGESEVKLAATHAATGLAVRGMLDKVRRSRDAYVIADLKVSAIDPTHEHGVSKRIHEFRYHWQAAAYWDLATAYYGKPPAAFVFIWCHKEPPYLVRALPLDLNAVQLGREQNQDALVELKRRLDADDWFGPGHNEVTETVVDVPDYAYSEARHAQTFREFLQDGK